MIELYLFLSATCYKSEIVVQHSNLYIRESAVIFMKDKVMSCGKQKYLNFCTVQTNKESLEVAESCSTIQEHINQLK